MKEVWIALAKIPPTGKVLTYSDQTFWQEAFLQFALDCKLHEPIQATFQISPQSEGVLFQGMIQGSVLLSCTRCMEETCFRFSKKFQNYEALPDFENSQADCTDNSKFDAFNENLIRINKQTRGIDINPMALAWEEFSLSLPLKPLCFEDCKGLCIYCGCNKNKFVCACSENNIDLRLAPLQGLRIKK